MLYYIAWMLLSISSNLALNVSEKFLEDFR